MNLTDEQTFIVLLSISELGGSATKAHTLNNIEEKKYYHLDERDLTWKENRNEQIWRNELAFARKRLEVEGCIDGALIDNWELTDKGRNRLSQLAVEVVRSSYLKKLTPAAQIAAQRLVELQSDQRTARMPYDDE